MVCTDCAPGHHSQLKYAYMEGKIHTTTLFENDSDYFKVFDLMSLEYEGLLYYVYKSTLWWIKMFIEWKGTMQMEAYQTSVV